MGLGFGGGGGGCERAVEEGEGCYGAVGVAGVGFILGIAGETSVVCLRECC